MKNYLDYKIYDHISFPILIASEDLAIEYCNKIARKTLASICRATSLKSVVADRYADVCACVKRGEVVNLNDNFGPYMFITLLPVTFKSKRKVFVFAEHSFSVFKSTDRFSCEKHIFDVFGDMYDIFVRGINGTIDRIFQLPSGTEIKMVYPHLTSITTNFINVSGVIENLMSVLRLQFLIGEKNVECIDLVRFFADTDKLHGVFDLSGLSLTDLEILYNPKELSCILGDIADFFLENCDGNIAIKVLAKPTGSHIILSFSVPSQKRRFDTENVFDLQSRKRRTSLFFVKKTVELRGGNVLFRKNGHRYEVLLSLRRMLPQDYSGYLANDRDLVKIV